MPAKTKSNGTVTTENVEEIRQVTITRLRRESVEVPIVGVTPLIMHNWDPKSKRMMLDKQQNKASEKKAAKDPVADYEAAFYRMEDGRPGMPSSAFKAAIADAARFYGKTITMEALKRSIFVKGEGPQQLVHIDGEVTMREDTPRNNGGTCDLRYRPEFWPWKAVLVVEFLPVMFTAESVWNLVDAGGTNGVGDWRPSSPKSKTGTYGQFRVAV